MMPLLILQFLIGMFANLFVTFSISTNPNPLAAIFTSGSPALILHVRKKIPARSAKPLTLFKRRPLTGRTALLPIVLEWAFRLMFPSS